MIHADPIHKRGANSMKTRLWLMSFFLLSPSAIGAALLLPRIYRVDLKLDAPVIQRFLAMSMDDDGYIWIGNSTKTLFRYDPRKGAIKIIPMPISIPVGQFIASALAMNGKVYLLLEKSPVLAVYHPQSGEFTTLKLPSHKANTWYGTTAGHSPYLYLFDRDVSGLIKWDTRNDTYSIIPYPYQGPLPWAGTYVKGENALYCAIWNGNKIVRLNLATSRFDGEYPTPWKDAQPTGVVPLRDKLYVSDRLNGRLLVFNLTLHSWAQAIRIPDYGKVFGFVGAGIEYRDIAYFSLSTYKNEAGDSIDGKPYHFLDRFLAYDPRTGGFGYLQLPHQPDEYPQTAYLLAGSDGHLYFFGQDIYDPKSGVLEREYHGKATAYQTRPVASRHPVRISMRMRSGDLGTRLSDL